MRRLLGLKVKRNWYQPEAVVLARSAANPPTCPNLQGVDQNSHNHVSAGSDLRNGAGSHHRRFL